MSQSYEAQGIIHSIGQAQEFGQNGFIKREFILKLTGEGENDQYPNHVGFELHKDKCALIDGYQLGMEIKVAFNLGGRLWAGNGQGEKAFPQMTVWKLANVHAQQQQAPQYAPQAAPQQAAPQYAPQAPPQMSPQMAPQPMQQPASLIAATNYAQPQAAPQAAPAPPLAQVPPGSPESKRVHPDGSPMYDVNGAYQLAVPF